MTGDSLLLQLNENLKTICRDVGELKGVVNALDEKLDGMCSEVKDMREDVDKLKDSENKKIGMAMATAAFVSFLGWVVTTVV